MRVRDRVSEGEPFESETGGTETHAPGTGGQPVGTEGGQSTGPTGPTGPRPAGVADAALGGPAETIADVPPAGPPGGPFGSRRSRDRAKANANGKVDGPKMTAAERMRALRAAGFRKSNYGPGHLKVDAILKEEDRAAYLAYLRDPNTTDLSAVQWMRDRGYSVGETAVAKHRRRFRARLTEMRRAAEMAHAFADLARDLGIGQMTDATMARVEQMLMEQMFEMGQLERQPFTPKEWGELNRAIGEGIANRRNAEALRREFEQAKRQAANEADRAARRGGDGKAVADRVREVLGIPLDDLPMDD